MAFKMSKLDLFRYKGDFCEFVVGKIECISYILLVLNFLSCRVNY